MVLFSFLSLQNYIRSQNSSLLKLEKIYQKRKKNSSFEKWKKTAQKIYKSPQSYRYSYNPSLYKETSPKSAITQRGTYQIPKRFGFYSNKRLSVDNVHKYIDQMIKVIPPSQKCGSPNIFSTAPTVSFMSDNHPHSRNYSTFINK